MSDIFAWSLIFQPRNMGKIKNVVHVFLSIPFEIAPMNSGFIPLKIDGFCDDKKQINSVCEVVWAHTYVIIRFKGD